jgi:2',3'-cyclic-nucleotide 2'-phosphodiesterase (5'-nucleotidase family)
MRRFLPHLLSASVLAVAPLAAQAPESRPTIRCVILHTNDVHGQIRPVPDPRSRNGTPRMVGGYQELVAAIDEERAAVPYSILVDAGDWWQGTPEGTLSKGRCTVELMNAAGYDLAVVGNHDFDAGPAALLDLLRLARFPVMGANVSADAEDPIAAATAALLRSSPELFRAESAVIAIGGLVTEETPRITSRNALRGLRIAPNAVGGALARSLVRLPEDRRDGAGPVPGRPDADVFVLVNHESRERNLELAKTVPGLDVVIGGHFHSDVLREGVVASNGVLLAQAAANTRGLGVVTLEIDAETRRVVKKTARVREIEARPELSVPRLAPIIARYEAEVARTMDVEVCDVPEYYGRGADWEKPGLLPAWIAQVMIARTGAALAVHNHGGIRADLPPGRARVREFFQISPFGNRLVSVEMSVADVLELAARSAQNPGRGFVVGGATVVYRKSADGARTVVGLRQDGRDLPPETRLRVATTDFLALAKDGATAFGRATDYRDHDETLLDATLAEARRQKTLVPASLPGYLLVE